MYVEEADDAANDAIWMKSIRYYYSGKKEGSMPTYEYECTECGHRFEKFQKMTDKPVSKCPQCKGKVRRLIGLGGGVIFKGPGFYTTEYRSEAYKKREREEKQGVSTGSSSSCSSCSATSCSTCKK